MVRRGETRSWRSTHVPVGASLQMRQTTIGSKVQGDAEETLLYLVAPHQFLTLRGMTMQGQLRASVVQFGLVYAILIYIGSLLQINASPLLSVIHPRLSLNLPPSLANFNLTSGPKWEAGWPDKPFAVPIETESAHDQCCLYFPIVGARLGSSSESQFFLLEVLEQLVNLKAQPAGSIPHEFDVAQYDVRFKMELVPQHALSLDLAITSLNIIYKTVLASQMRAFRALVVCQKLALGRFTSCFLE